MDQPAQDTTRRDPFVDFVRAASLVVVVLWHWVFTVVLWQSDGPHASNPIGFTSGLYLATWLLQVMPLFFFVGGWAHTVAIARFVAEGRGSVWRFTLHRIGSLGRPAVALAVAWWIVGAVVAAAFDVSWTGRAVLLILSPLWFLAIYAVLVAMLPLTTWLHRRFDVLVLVWGAGLAALVDVGRFRYGWEALGWLNMVLVWGLCHQLGFFYDRLVRAPRQIAWSMAFGGLFTLSALVLSGLYPGSMVGVPGDRLSNMAPPTVCIAALLVLQVGVALLMRPWVVERLQSRSGWQRANRGMNRVSLPLYLFHSTGMAIWVTVIYRTVGFNRAFGMVPSVHLDAVWWFSRPLAVIGPLACTAPMIWAYLRFHGNPTVAPDESPEPPLAAPGIAEA
jgi:hypothetical protein